jgi:hypothetical protein
MTDRLKLEFPELQHEDNPVVAALESATQTRAKRQAQNMVHGSLMLLCKDRTRGALSRR